MIGIIDYGGGNLRSVKKAFDYLGESSTVVGTPDQLRSVSKVVLPGVGFFGSALKTMRQNGIQDALTEWTSDNRPFLGICLGMQLMMDSSEESPGEDGLSIISGGCSRLQQGRVPHMGWNSLALTEQNPLFEGVDTMMFYFVHSYIVTPETSDCVDAFTEYGCSFPSVIRKNNCVGVQFHPEKSGKDGLTFLKNWSASC